MSRILESFKEWQTAIDEQITPNRVKLTNDINQKAVINPIDKTSFKVRAKWTDDMIDANGRLTPSGFNAILAEIRNYIDPSTGQASLINYYSGLKDLNKNMVIYDVIRDTDTAKDPNPKVRKQSFKFTVVSRELYPNVPKSVWYIRQDEVTKAQAGQDVQAGTSTSTGEVLTSSDTFGIDFSRGAVYITNPNDPKLIKLIDSFYFKLRADEVLSNLPAVLKFGKAVAGELKAGKLGDNSKAFIVALNAAFGIVTRYGDVETGITQQLLQKLKGVKSNAPGADANGIKLSEVTDFNKEAFISNLSATSDIKAPAGGFKKGAVVRDPEFMKFQQLLAQKFGKSMSSSKIYKNFAKFKTGGADGTYGPNTANLVGLLKKVLIDPTWTGNQDKNVVDQDFINRIAQEKVSESYLALDGFTLISEGIDMAAVAEYEKTVTTQSVNRRRDNSNQVNTKGGKYLLQGKDGFEYSVKDKAWHYRKDGGNLLLVVNPNSIKRLIAKYPEAGAYYIITKTDNNKLMRANKHIYKLENGEWQVQLAGSTTWEKVEAGTDLSSLNKMYSGSSYTSVGTSTGTLDKDKIDGFVDSLYGAMTGGQEAYGAVYTVYNQIKSAADLVALHSAFNKDSRAQGQNLSAWLEDDLSQREVGKINDLLVKTGLDPVTGSTTYAQYRALYQQARAKSK